MSVAEGPIDRFVARPTGLPTRKLADAALWLAILLGGFVFIEPAPYDLFLCAAIPLWMLAGLAVPRAISPLIVFMILFMTGGLLAATQAKHLDAQPMYYAISGFLALSACFFACVFAARPARLEILANAWIAAAAATAFLGFLGYFGVTGGLFTKFGRASGGFQDPNVFGPFLVFPLVVLTRRIMTGSLGRVVVSGALALVILAGVFLSFSRAAWGLSMVCMLVQAGILFLTERRAALRARYVGMGAIGIVALVAMLAAILSVPAVRDLYAERAHVVQDYDSGHMGRFERHAVGFNMMLDYPLGIGAKEFGLIFREDEHDIWLKALTSYGWLGFAAFLALVVWTIAAAFPLVFRPGPLQFVAQAAYIVFVGHVIMATVIDIDHWRHVFLLFGILWGVVAADKARRQRELGAPAQGPPPVTHAVSAQASA